MLFKKNFLSILKPFFSNFDIPNMDLKTYLISTRVPTLPKNYPVLQHWLVFLAWYTFLRLTLSLFSQMFLYAARCGGFSVWWIKNCRVIISKICMVKTVNNKRTRLRYKLRCMRSLNSTINTNDKLEITSFTKHRHAITERAIKTLLIYCFFFFDSKHYFPHYQLKNAFAIFPNRFQEFNIKHLVHNEIPSEVSIVSLFKHFVAKQF